jgi:hypothetical protein
MRTRIFLALVLILFFGLVQVKADELSGSVDFSTADLVFSSSKGFDIIYLKGSDITDQVGEPQLPVKLLHVALPPGSKVEQVVVTKAKSQILPNDYHIFPAQPPQILSLMNESISFVQPKPRVYNLLEEYPGKLVEYTKTGFMGGYQLAGLLVYPVQYIPAQKKIKFYSRIEFKIHYTSGGKTPLPVKKRSKAVEAVYEKIIQEATLNPKHATLNMKAKKLLPSPLPPGDYEYVIITDTTFVDTFQTLANWKTKKGVPATIVTTDWIYANYSGYDNAEKVRNFIKDAYQNWGTIWVLLGGDTNMVPDRIAWAMDCEYGGTIGNEIRCDLYYSDLDGTWDANGNHIYGEVEDSIDMYPDVFVGRASCSSLARLEWWLPKLLTYEINPPTDYQTNMLLFAMVLWWDPYTDGGIAKNLIDDKYVPPQFDPITKVYESSGGTEAQVLAAMNSGQNIMNHNGHAWYDVMAVNRWESLNRSDMLYLNNHPRNSILYSIGCWPAAFDYYCIAEAFLISEHGGGVAFVGNSRYGWGSPGNPEYGYSDRFDQQFFAALFSRDVYHIGATLADMKAFYIPRARQENVYRWCEYEINLLGEPEMPIWTDNPEYMTVEYSDTIPQGASLFTVTVFKANGSPEPVPGALVCVMKGEEIYQRGLTDSQGQIDLNISPSSGGQLYVTVTAHNFMPYQDSAWVAADGPYVVYKSHRIDDAVGGNKDGLVNPGEVINMFVNLENYGNDVAYNVGAILHSTADPYITLIDSLQDFGTISPGETATNFDAYSFSVDPSCPNDHVIYFDLEIADEGEGLWHNIVALTVASPILAYERYMVNDSDANANGIPEPGETFELDLWVRNIGLGFAREVTGELSTSDPYLAIDDSMADFSDFSPEEVRIGTFEITVLPGCPTPHFPRLSLVTSTSDAYAFQDSFILSIGEAGFEDDMESGAGGWTHAGIGDLWHLTSHRANSGDSSWYNGIEGSWNFDNNMNCWLKSPPMTIEPEAYLSFWLWYDVTNYDVDGIYVEVFHSEYDTDTLDFIGTGGALDSLYNTGNDWLEWRYDLSYIPAGSIIQVRFSFVSDDQYPYDGEGFYIDDLKVGPIITTIPGDVTGDEKVDIADVLFLINYLFQQGPSFVPLEIADVNCDDVVDIADLVYLINYLFVEGPLPQECE